jgi:hypothetical protein
MHGPPDPDAKREANRIAQAEYRARKRKLRNVGKRRLVARKKAGLVRTGPVEYDAEMLQFLVDNIWLSDAAADDPVEIGKAVSALWRESARGTEK